MALPGFLYRNLAAGLTPTGTSTTPVAGLGYDKLNDPQPRHRARVAATSMILVFDLGSAQSVDCAALISTSLPAGCTARLRASTADATVVSSLLLDTGVQSNVTDPEYNGNVIATFASVSARYWRWDLASATNPIDIGLAPIGLMFRPAIAFDYGAQEGRHDFSTRDVNPDTGAEFPLSGPKKRCRLLTFGALSESEIRGLTTSFSDMDRTIGGGGDTLFVEDSDAAWLTRARDSIWGGFRELGPAFATRAHPDYWTRSFRVTERL